MSLGQFWREAEGGESGIDMMNATYQYLDLVPKGRDEQDLLDPQAWVSHHDRYED